jgi:adapter protein MecA 1/2
MMKAERINQNQIRFTLSAEDLSQRNIQISELSYGSDKAKALFHDMMVAAKQEFGFDFSSQPVVIEAVPLAKDSIMITVTKIRKAGSNGSMPDSVPLRSKDSYDSDLSRDLHSPLSEADDLQMLLTERTSLFTFSDFSTLCRAASMIPDDLSMKNRLYWDTQSNLYYIHAQYKLDNEKTHYAICILYEFASEVDDDPMTVAYLKEHTQCLLGARALQKLKQIT